jgi:hypothetical protein
VQVIQFEYGGDNLDPMMMEGNGKPVDFARILHLVRANYPHREEDNLGKFADLCGWSPLAKLLNEWGVARIGQIYIS